MPPEMGMGGKGGQGLPTVTPENVKPGPSGGQGQDMGMMRTQEDFGRPSMRGYDQQVPAEIQSYLQRAQPGGKGGQMPQPQQPPQGGKGGQMPQYQQPPQGGQGGKGGQYQSGFGGTPQTPPSSAQGGQGGKGGQYQPGGGGKPPPPPSSAQYMGNVLNGMGSKGGSR